MKSKRHATTVAILGPFGGGNLGDAAIQQAVLAQLGIRRRDIRIVGISMVPADTRERHGIETYAYDADALLSMRQESRTVNSGTTVGATGGTLEQASNARRFKIPEFLRRFKYAMSHRAAKMWRVVYEFVHPIYIVKKLMKIDLLLVSGGGQLDEFWGGAWAHPYTLFKWAALSRLTRTKVAFLSVGAGTVSSPVSQWFLRQALRMSNYRSYRDTGSKEIVRDCLKFDRNDPVVPDMAYAYPVSTPITASSHNTGRLIVAVGLMPYCHPKVWPIRNSAAYERYVSVLTEFCRQLMLKDITLRFFVGQTRHDPPVIQEVIEKLLSQYQDRVKLQVEVPHMNTVEDLITCLSDADIVVASRYHGVLLASLLRRPILSLSYERKVRKLMTDLDLGEFCLDIEQADTENLAVMFTKIEARRKSISIELDSRVRHETNAVLAQFDRIVATLLP